MPVFAVDTNHEWFPDPDNVDFPSSSMILETHIPFHDVPIVFESKRSHSFELFPPEAVAHLFHVGSQFQCSDGQSEPLHIIGLNKLVMQINQMFVLHFLKKFPADLRRYSSRSIYLF